MSKVNYRSDFREAYNYDSSIDYSKEVEKWNKATELRQRGFEVWKWDRLPDWKENL